MSAHETLPAQGYKLLRGNAGVAAAVYPVNFDNLYPPETLICEAPKIRPHRDAFGSFLYDITYIFVSKNQNPAYPQNNGWNAFLRPKVTNPDMTVSMPGWDRLIGKDGATMAAPTADFNQLFV